MWDAMAFAAAAAIYSAQMERAKPYLSSRPIEFESTPDQPERCACCGSRQFRRHHARLICSYCRSEP